jgi:predicted aspartyl protease
MAITGFFKQDGHPYLNIEVYGFSDQFKQSFEAMLDTGFTGFLQLPLVSSFTLGLILAGIANYTLADGKTQLTLLCYGNIKINDEIQSGIISMSGGDSILLGVEFLKKFNKSLTLDCNNQAFQLLP